MSESENPENTPKRTGKGAMNGNETGIPYSKDNQPSPEAKKEGIRRAKSTRDLLNRIVGEIPGTSKDYVQLTAAFFNIEADEVTVRMIMDFRQAEKAIKGNTQAYKVVTDRAFGRPAPEKVEDIEAKDEKVGSKSRIDLGGGIFFDV
jgi:hypothetical protein